MYALSLNLYSVVEDENVAAEFIADWLKIHIAVTESKSTEEVNLNETTGILVKLYQVQF